jgi:3-oxoacyl-[acyl-carrier protein] reductase
MSAAEGRAAAANRTFDEIQIGDVFAVERAFSMEDVLAFAALSGDFSPLHVDAAYAAATEFGGCVVHGILLASLLSQLVGMRIPGEPALYLGQDLTFRRPVLVGENVRAIAKVTGKSAATQMLVLATEIRGPDDKVVVAGTAKVKVRANAAPSRDEAHAASDAATSAAAAEPSRPRCAIVTGGSGGIGAEIARTLARRGHAVAINYMQRVDRATTVVASIEHFGGMARAFRADVRDAHAVDTMLADVTAHFGAPGILVNAAIGDLESRPFHELTWTQFQGHLDYQVKAAFNLCQGVYPLMKQTGGGAVVNVLSQVTTGTPPPNMADYVTAKHALEGLSKALASEWAADGIRVNMVSPGLTRTELTEFQHERVFKMEAARTPLRRLATAEDIARAVAYLALDESSFLTGTNLFVTGGQVML